MNTNDLPRFNQKQSSLKILTNVEPITPIINFHFLFELNLLPTPLLQKSVVLPHHICC
jgi:hypothetical protein